MLTSSTLFIGDDDGTIKSLAVLDKNRTNAWFFKTIGNNSLVSEWKEMSDCLNLLLAFYWPHFVSRFRDNEQLVNHFIINVPRVVSVCKHSGRIRISF